MIRYRRIFPPFAARFGDREASIAIPGPIGENEGPPRIATATGSNRTEAPRADATTDRPPRPTVNVDMEAGPPFFVLERADAMTANPQRGDAEETEAMTSSSSTSTPPPRPKRPPVPDRNLSGMVLGDFRVERLIGRGGMGEVYLAKQISLNRSVALKVLLPEWLSRPAYKSRFEIEATAVARLNHPNIVQVYALGEQDGVHYIAMEYVEGMNLREYLIRKGTLDLPLALSIMRQSANAIGAAGEIGLIHRDLKPENLLLTRKGRIKVADFGLCRDLDSDRHHVTQQGTTMGTPLYMSPEQAQGHAMDHRSDLYSLGVTYYHMLTGEPPFRAETALALALKHVREQPLSPRVRRPDLPVELDRLIMKLLEKRPEDRHQSAAEMLVDLAKIRQLIAPVASGLLGEVSGIAPAEDATAAERSITPTPSSAASGSVKSAPLLSKMIAAPLAAAASDPSWFGPRALAASAAVGLVIGGLLGWRTVANDRAALRTTAKAAAPALWIGPRWAAIPKRETPEEQYRQALLLTPPAELPAAWLAVPGYFPRSHEWSSAAYLQLGRVLYRERDGDRMKALADEIAQWKSKQTRDEELVEILEAAGNLLKRDVDGVIESLSQILNRTDRPVSDPGLIDFCVEIVTDALEAAAAPGATGAAVLKPKLTTLQSRLLTLRNRVRAVDLAVR